jgi:hypothetical protein
MRLVIVFFASIAGMVPPSDVEWKLIQIRGWLPRGGQEGQMAQDSTSYILRLQTFRYGCADSDRICPRKQMSLRRDS